MKSLNALLDGRSERERWILLGGIFAGIPLLVWLLLWQPLLDARASAEERLAQRQQIYSWMQGAAAQVTPRAGEGSHSAPSVALRSSRLPVLPASLV